MAMIGGKDSTVVERWVLDASKYKAELRTVASEIRKEERAAKDAAKANEALGHSAASSGESLKSMGIKAAAAAVSIGLVARAIDKTMTEGTRLLGLYKNQSMSIEAAAQATEGLISRTALVEGANRAAALGVKLTSEEFANLSRAAAIASQKMGVDLGQAINDITTGIGRASPKILDNLGIVVKADAAYEAYAQKIGKTKEELTDAEKATGYQAAAMAELSRIANGATLQTAGLGASFAKLKITVKDTADEVSMFLASLSAKDFGAKGGGPNVNTAKMGVDSLNAALRLARDPLKKLTDQSREFIRIMAIGIGMGPAWKQIFGVVDAVRAGKSAADAVAASGMSFEGSATRKGGTSFGGGEFSHNPLGSAFGTTVLGGKGRGKVRSRRRRGNAAKGIPIEVLLGMKEGDDIGAQNDGLSLGASVGTTADQRAGMSAYKAQSEEILAADKRRFELSLKMVQRNKQLDQSFKDIAVGGLSQFAAGMWSAADAAIQSGQSFGTAMLAMTKGVLLGIASQATIKSLFYLAEGFANWWNPMGAGYFKAAALMGGVAVAAGAAGLGIGAATASPGGGGGGSTSGAADRSAPQRSLGDKKDRDEMRKIVVEVYYGDSRDRGAMIMDRRRTVARLAA